MVSQIIGIDSINMNVCTFFKGIAIFKDVESVFLHWEYDSGFVAAVSGKSPPFSVGGQD